MTPAADYNRKIFSVLEAKQVNSGKITVNGIIISRSISYKTISKSEWVCQNIGCSNHGSMKFDPPSMQPPKKLDNTDGNHLRCPECQSDAYDITHEYHDTVSIQLVDTDNADNHNSLDVILYDEASKKIVAGEVVTIFGNIRVQKRGDTVRGKRLVNVLHSNSISYRNKEDLALTDKDIEIICKHKKIVEKYSSLTYIDTLVGMFAPNVIGHNDKKLGLLRSLVGGSLEYGDENGRRGRIHTFLVGDPGLAKSLLAREATNLLPNSRYVTATNASGKSLVVIIDKENDSLVARYGAIVLSRGSICVINELGAMNLDDQKHLLDIAEEGRCTIDKYGFHLEIDSPTTIIATANPYGQTWSGFKVSKDEIPSLKTFLDRCDQIFGFIDAPSAEEIKEYPKKKTAIRNRRRHNYNSLRKVLAYMRTINPKFTADAEEMLNQFWINSKKENLATNRTYDSLFRMAVAQARLNLSHVINEEIATQVMNSLSLMWSQYGKIAKVIMSPRELTYQVFYRVLNVAQSGMTINELCKRACDVSNEVKDYLGDKFSLEHNHKLKSVIDDLMNNSHIRRIGDKPVVLKYVDSF
jgi:DNA replicative helicase MCM subunit Mcm2 (Cdc46/Mcm family)